MFFCSLCPTFKSNISNPQYLCYPYLSDVGQLRLKAFAAITEGLIIFLMESSCLSDSDEANSGYERLGLMEYSWYR